MFEKWFGTRTPRASERNYSFRPELEYLEGRLAPSAMMPMDSNNNGNGNGSPGHVNVHIQENIHNNIHITNSFNGSTITNAFSGQNLGLMAFPQSSLQGFFTTLYMQAAAVNATAANALVGEEAQLAIDTFLMIEGVQGLDTNISSLQSAIATNEATLGTPGVLLGQVTYAVVLDALAR